MEALLIAFTPVVVSAVMALVKKIPTFASITNGYRVLALRTLVAGLSFVAYVGEVWVMGGEVDPVSTEAFVMTLLNFLGATGTYFLFKRK